MLLSEIINKPKHVIYQIEECDKPSHLVLVLILGDLSIKKCHSDIVQHRSESRSTMMKLGKLCVKLKMMMRLSCWYHDWMEIKLDANGIHDENRDIIHS